MIVSLIAAIAENGVIGRNNTLPWKLKADMKFFVSSTKGHTVIMGRLNYDSIGRPLPRRENIVISRDPNLQIPGCRTTTSLESALTMAVRSGEEEAFIIGGAQIYSQALPYAHRFYRTRVLAEVTGDVLFPHYSEEEWVVEPLAVQKKDDDNEFAVEIELLTRRNPVRSFQSDQPL